MFYGKFLLDFLGSFPLISFCSVLPCFALSSFLYHSSLSLFNFSCVGKLFLLLFPTVTFSCSIFSIYLLFFPSCGVISRHISLNLYCLFVLHILPYFALSSSFSHSLLLSFPWYFPLLNFPPPHFSLWGHLFPLSPPDITFPFILRY